MQSNGAIPADGYGFLYLIIYYDRFIYVNVYGCMRVEVDSKYTPMSRNSLLKFIGGVCVRRVLRCKKKEIASTFRKDGKIFS